VSEETETPPENQDSGLEFSGHAVPQTQSDNEAAEHGKHVSFLELYLDLVFVLAVGQLAHLIIDDPRLRTIWITLGLFVALWWTWVGFTVLYNRHGSEDRWHRILFLTASAPVGVAAVAVGPASTGHITAFAVSLAATRVLLAVGHTRDDDPNSTLGDALRRRSARAYALSAVVFIASIWVPSPFRYILWLLAYGQESNATLAYERGSQGWRGRRANHTAAKQSDPGAALDAQHFAERFGLFIIILLGEVVVEAGEGASDGRTHSAALWAGLVGAMALAATLWWTYFAAAAETDLKRLELSGGSPAVARAIFAVGQMVPAFALLVAASGVGLLLREDPAPGAYWLACVGTGLYVSGTDGYARPSGPRNRVARFLAMAVVYSAGALHHVLSAPTYIWLLALMVAGNTALVSMTSAAVTVTGSDPSTSGC
jgi:low temperature requirement protein LtrA